MNAVAPPKAAPSGKLYRRLYDALREDGTGVYQAISRTIREDRDFPRRCYAALRRLVAPRTLLSRRRAARRWASAAPFRIPRDDGFRVVPAGALAEADEVVAAAREIAQASDPMGLIRKGRKAFMVNLLDKAALTRESPLLRLALRPDILASVSDYLGVVPVLTHVDVFFSSSSDKRMISSKLFHCDGDDTTQVKLFVLCSDVSAENGPLTILPAAASERVRRKLRYKYGTRLADSEVEAVVGDAGRRAVTGPAGTVCLVDTSRCFHFGSRVEDEAEPRLVAMIQYSTPFSFMLPRDPSRRAPFRHLGKSDAVELEQLVLKG
ncbi:MAG TPA: hypothetical protein VGN09_24795 [Vicinamibacteria bacterium]|jgi:hypothetical protein